jgi:Na+/H+ antiporter NhaD/arsenite permease-like protein
MAERAGTPIGFLAFLRVGLPATIISIALATAYIWARYVLL